MLDHIYGQVYIVAMDIKADNLFRILSDGTRLRSLMLLVEHTELCVCELTHALELSQPKISRHLAQLRDAGLVQDRKEGLWVYYRLHPKLPKWVTEILDQTHTITRKQQPYASDLASLADMPNRPGASCCA